MSDGRMDFSILAASKENGTFAAGTGVAGAVEFKMAGGIILLNARLTLTAVPALPAVKTRWHLVIERQDAHDSTWASVAQVMGGSVLIPASTLSIYGESSIVMPFSAPWILGPRAGVEVPSALGGSAERKAVNLRMYPVTTTALTEFAWQANVWTV